MKGNATSAGGKETRELSAWNGFFTYTHESLDREKMAQSVVCEERKKNKRRERKQKKVLGLS